MGPGESHVKESLRIEYGLLRVGEKFLHDLYACFCSAGSVRVPPHAVEDQHHCRRVRDDHGRTVLVVLTVSERGNFGVFDLHKLGLALLAINSDHSLKW